MRKSELDRIVAAAILATDQDELNNVIGLVEKINNPDDQSIAAELVGQTIGFRLETGDLPHSLFTDGEFTEGEIACMALGRFTSDVPKIDTLD